MSIQTPNRFIKQPEILERFNISKSTMYNRINSGLFPKPCSLGDRAVAWLESDLNTIFNAIVAGKSNEELKNIVTELHSSRSH
ncbi:helix-turn-helix transcriptional regulator [Catenovulum adriaticum]|uniref:AlpA family phage regulatory protein n=1 Tax=Catenovulum adriaticum TaxID=2984846 RepID=A0ABY7AM61_9ALTE|nr:AlpA family phage regulatory protein [Catenovulum sp. TS8]WAJ69751.1 AlpA family phage regulatory protein [Catenovulum sp. TS8]